MLFKQHFVFMLCWKINIPFPSAFLFQHLRLLISIRKLILSCVQAVHQPSVFAYLRFPLSFLFAFFSCLLGSAQHYSEACLGGKLHDESLFGQKIHIATSNKNNLSLLM